VPYDEESSVLGLGEPLQVVFLQKEAQVVYQAQLQLEQGSNVATQVTAAQTIFNREYTEYLNKTLPQLPMYQDAIDGTSFESQLFTTSNLYNAYLVGASNSTDLLTLYTSLNVLDVELKKTQRRIQKSPRGNRAFASSIISIDPVISQYDSKTSNTYLNVNWALPCVAYDSYVDASPNGALYGTTTYKDVVSPYILTRGMNADFNQRPYLMSYSNIYGSNNYFTPATNSTSQDVIVGVNKMNLVFIVDFNATSNGELIASSVNSYDTSGSNYNYNAITTQTIPSYKVINHGFMGSGYYGNIGGSFCSSFDTDALYTSSLNYSDGWNVYPNKLPDFKTGANVWDSDGNLAPAGDVNVYIPSFTSYVNKIITNPYHPDFGKIAWITSQMPRVGNMAGTYNQNGVVYFFDASGRLYCADAETGERLIVIDESSTNAMAPPLVVDGVLYKATCTWSSWLQPLDADQHKTRYVTQLEIYTLDGK
jgi:hypothetical protein